jgi:hypothetical protein
MRVEDHSGSTPCARMCYLVLVYILGYPIFVFCRRTLS